MRKGIRWGLSLLVVLALAAGAFMMLREGTPTVSPVDGSAALGLMLLDEEQGVYVLAVTSGSQADVAGILPGDWLLKAGDADIQDASMLDGVIAENDEVSLTIRRDQRELTLTLPCK